jgi:ABC-type taurine transport system ATPase subunit
MFCTRQSVALQTSVRRHSPGRAVWPYGAADRAGACVGDDPRVLLDEPLGKLDSPTRTTLRGEAVGLWRCVGFTGLVAEPM